MELLSAAAEHGQGMHGPFGLVILIALVVGAVIFALVRLVRSRRRPTARSEDNEGREG